MVNPTNSTENLSQIVEVTPTARWEVYYRLQELNISCSCSTNEPLRVQLSSATEAIQLWSILKQVNSSCSQLSSWLDKCWQIENFS